MDLLILGGTRFMGRRMVEYALGKGHRVTLFHRGTTGEDLFEGQVERILGDRDGQIDKLAGRQWDAVIDTPGYYPRVVRDSCEFLKGSVGRYLFISSISAYDPEEGATKIDEGTRLATLKDETIEEITNETYGGLKALCEKAVRDVLGDSSIIVRPGFIVGPNDPSDRFTYWPVRIAQGGEVLAGGRKDEPLQVIDANDIGPFCVKLLEQGAEGIFNVCGPEKPYTWEDFLTRSRAAIGSNCEFVWIDDEKLKELDVEPGRDLPLYHGSDPGGDAFMRVDNTRAVAAGLTFTPLEQTVVETLEWAQSRGETELKVGLSREREREVLGRVAPMTSQ